MTLYRKYRPQTLSELDNVAVREKLKQVLTSEYKPSAYLFAGPKGTGKTSTARIVAKILNCEKLGKTNHQSSIINHKSLLDSIDPCNVCESCVAITEGRHLDIIEIDAASNRGIDEVRDLRDKIKLSPVSAQYKVYIIDEVHMMTTEAFNALLKTLEEPPSHAVFIFATTEPEKLPATISSRCSRFHFSKATIEELVLCLTRVAKGEKVKVDEAVLELIAAAADGSFRDGVKLMEQALSENALTPDKIQGIVGKSNVTGEEFLSLLSEKDSGSVLSRVLSMTANGTDIRIFITELLHTLHGILLTQYGVGKVPLKEGTLSLFTKTDILQLIKLFSRVYTELRTASKPELPLEVAVVEWCEKK